MTKALPFNYTFFALDNFQLKFRKSLNSLSIEPILKQQYHIKTALTKLNFDDFVFTSL